MRTSIAQISRMKKSIMTSEGKRVQRMLIQKYNMRDEDAMRLLIDGGSPLAIALLKLSESYN